jgi:hypothetical protein
VFDFVSTLVLVLVWLLIILLIVSVRMVLFVMLLKLELGLGLSKVYLGPQSVIILCLYLKQWCFRLLGARICLLLLHSEVGLVLRNASDHKIDCNIVKIRVTIINIDLLLLSQDIVVCVEVVNLWMVNHINWIHGISLIVWDYAERYIFGIVLRISLEKELFPLALLGLGSLWALWAFLLLNYMRRR